MDSDQPDYDSVFEFIDHERGVQINTVPDRPFTLHTLKQIKSYLTDEHNTNCTVWIPYEEPLDKAKSSSDADPTVEPPSNITQFFIETMDEFTPYVLRSKPEDKWFALPGIKRFSDLHENLESLIESGGWHTYEDLNIVFPDPPKPEGLVEETNETTNDDPVDKDSEPVAGADK